MHSGGMYCYNWGWTVLCGVLIVIVVTGGVWWCVVLSDGVSMVLHDSKTYPVSLV